METITLKVTKVPSVKFKGTRIGFSCTTDQRGAGIYSQETGRWEELSLYRTESGKLIGYRVKKTKWVGESNHYSYKVCATPEEIIDYFGQEEVASELYRDAKIENVEVIT
ncbi:hypothetical protein [Spongiibacter sp.]|uniref:hypothetical protein n=1 Tax=Spongiibacter sp. TaxID=2024860 RepID=UPI00258091A0|nr:hypothetical protein [Spongiibacter sp.]